MNDNTVFIGLGTNLGVREENLARALEDIKARLERATDLVDDEEIMAISGGNIIEAITKIRNEITSMPEEEYNRYDSLDREGKLQWMRDRGLLME